MNKSAQFAAAMAGAGILIASLTYAYQQVAPHVSEESCIIQGMRAAPDSSALLARACQDRFAVQPAEKSALPPISAAMINGRAGFAGNRFSAVLYNGGTAYTVTKLRISVTDPSTADSDNPTTHTYDMRVHLPPLSSSREEVDVYQTYDELRWTIDKAWGYPTES